MKHTMICFTQDRQLMEWQNVRPVLKSITFFTKSIWPADQLIITCIDRTQKENDAVGSSSLIHVVGGRAIDFRIRNLGDNFQEKIMVIAEKINRRWQYDYDRPNKVVAYALPHGTGPHLHLQVHPKTVETEFRIQENILARL